MTPKNPRQALARAAAAERTAIQRLNELMRDVRPAMSVPKIAEAVELTPDQVRLRLGEKARPLTREGKPTFTAKQKAAAEEVARARSQQQADELLNRQRTDLEPGPITVVEATRRLGHGEDVPVARSTVIKWIGEGRIDIDDSGAHPRVVTDELGRVVVRPKK